MRQNITKNNMKKYQDYAWLAYSIPEAAQALGVSLQRVGDLIQNGDLAHVRVGTRVLVSYEMLLRFIDQRVCRPPIQNSWVEP
jgi:excisionase family DNA binding protein